MQTDPTCQPDAAKPAEQRLSARLLIEMKALRIELRGECLDGVGGEGERPHLTPLPDLPYPRRNASAACSESSSARRRTMIGETISHSSCPAALRTTPLKVTMPVSGRLLETLASATSISSVMSSPGRSGAIQRNSLTPGEPSEAVRPMKPSNIIRIMIEHRCQPDADRPFSIEREAASSSRCIGCGSNSAAKARTSSRVTRRGPKVPKWPGGKSSKLSVMMGIAWGWLLREARLWPLFAAISTRLPAWLVSGRRTSPFGAVADLARNNIRS